MLQMIADMPRDIVGIISELAQVRVELLEVISDDGEICEGEFGGTRMIMSLIIHYPFGPKFTLELLTLIKNRSCVRIDVLNKSMYYSEDYVDALAKRVKKFVNGFGTHKLVIGAVTILSEPETITITGRDVELVLPVRGELRPQLNGAIEQFYGTLVGILDD